MNEIQIFITWTVDLQILGCTLICILVGIKYLEGKVDKITEGIRYLYETLDVVRAKMKDEESVITPNVLTWQENNHEINELHRTFNSVVKTMMIAHHPSNNLDTQLLNYCDAYCIE